MKIKQITGQNRRDFTAIFECEGCGHEMTRGGYDDRNFHHNVVPNIACTECGGTTRTLDADYRPLTPRYPEGFQI